MADDVLIMFSKAPVPGQVKTRLAVEIGPDAAAQLQEAFIADLGARFAALDCHRVVACSPSRDHPVFDALAALSWERQDQGAGDLGERLERSLRRARDAGARRVVFIGSDSPTLPARLVELAFEKLRQVEVVIGPVFDGGYYLVGARGPTPPLFDAIPWGTAEVFSTTIKNLDSARISYAVLPFWYDVDDFETLERLANHLGLTGPFGRFDAPRTERVLRELGL